MAMCTFVFVVYIQFYFLAASLWACHESAYCHHHCIQPGDGFQTRLTTAGDWQSILFVVPCLGSCKNKDETTAQDFIKML
jgi:hypothetical protein